MSPSGAADCLIQRVLPVLKLCSDLLHVSRGFGRTQNLVIVLPVISGGRNAAGWVGHVEEVGGDVRGEFRNVQVGDHFLHRGGVNDLLLQCAGERKRIETEVVDVPGNTFGESRNILIDLGSEKRSAFIAGNPQPMLNVILDLPGGERFEAMNNGDALA
jgi:hypothetical protein